MLATLERAFLTPPRSAMLWRCYNSSSSASRRKPNYGRQQQSNRSRHQLETIKPVRTVPNRKQQQIERERMEAELTRFEKEYEQHLEQYGDTIDEPDFSDLPGTYDKHVEQTNRMKDRIKTDQMTKKHYNNLLPKEICLLTWAEKENIRYLVETEPETWTPQTISEAYPISPKSVDKLLKSSLRLRRAKDVKAHDEWVAKKIRQIKSGEIPMSRELEERLKVRELIPLKIGELGNYMDPEEFVDLKPKKLGEFAKLVAPPSLKKDKSTEASKNTSVKYITDGAMVKDTLKQELTEDELRRIMRPEQRMTFAEFESKMERSKASNLAADMKYMLNLNISNSSPTRENDVQAQPSTDNFEGPPPGNNAHDHYDSSDSANKSIIQKYKPKDEAGVVTLNMEGEQAYLYDQDIGYQKPYDSTEIQERITIPSKLRKPNTVYKLGDCYYNEDGEFLYRVL